MRVAVQRVGKKQRRDHMIAHVSSGGGGGGGSGSGSGSGGGGGGSGSGSGGGGGGGGGGGDECATCRWAGETPLTSSDGRWRGPCA
jgi:hypothetical protein